MALLWWEKTVEYYFIKQYLEKVTIAPFDGLPEERLGDALTSFEGRAVLIEFKRDEDCLNSEKCKYKDWDKAKEDSIAKDASFHLMVWGALSDGVFKLKKCTYWDIGNKQNVEVWGASSFGDYVKTYGIDSTRLKAYTLFLQKNRKNSGGELSGGVDLNNCAVIIQRSENEWSVISLLDYERALERSNCQERSEVMERDSDEDEREMVL